MRYLALACVVAALVVVGLSPHFGRAVPLASNRPTLPPAALDNGCFPLPAGLHLDFPYQVRQDGDVATPSGVHRRLVLQYDELDAAQVRRLLDRELAAAGLAAGSATVAPIPDVGDAVVHGTVVLTLPQVKPPVGRPDIADQVCSDPASTKRSRG